MFFFKKSTKLKTRFTVVVLVIVTAFSVLIYVVIDKISSREPPNLLNSISEENSERELEPNERVSDIPPVPVISTNEVDDNWQASLEMGVDDKEVEMAMLRLSDDPLIKRIVAQIGKVISETTEESVHNLYQVNMYSWPGGGPRRGRAFLYEPIPLPANIGIRDTKSILSNRRFLKVYHELTNMPVEQASAIVNKELNLSLQKYLSSYAQHPDINSDYLTVDSMEKMKAENPKAGISGIGLTIETQDENKVVLLGLRLKVLSLVWIAGSLELKATAPSVQRVVQKAIEQRDGLYGDSVQSAYYKYEVLGRASLYNRQILTTGLCGTSPKSDQLVNKLKQIGLERMTMRSPVFDASLTGFDLPVRSGVAQADYTRGELSIPCFPAMDDKVFDQVIALHSALE